jgi:DNA replication protein DnaC
MTNPDRMRQRAQRLGLHGLVARWDEFSKAEWLAKLLDLEEEERARRSLERRLRRSKIGHFKPIADFDWTWPREIDREQIEDIIKLGFVSEAANVVVVGPNGVGKTTIAANIAHQALLAGHTVVRITASEMLADLSAQDAGTALQRRLRRYTTPTVLVVDEVGYLSYDSRHGDLLFEVVSKRHQQRSIVLTTNKSFTEWGDVFPNSSCVTALIDRLVHKAEIVRIDGESYRLKEAKERAERIAKERQHRRKPARAMSRGRQ